MKLQDLREFYWSLHRAYRLRGTFGLVERCYGKLPPRLRAYIDYTFFSDVLLNYWGGPLNGQAHRQLMVREIIAATAPALIVETGTFRGGTTSYLAGLSSSPIKTIETDRHFFLFARHVLEPKKNVEVTQLDSVAFLNDMVRKGEATAEPTLFYLDAHWYEYLPLRDELIIVFDNFPQAVVLIDDFEVPLDPGYRFDDYGEGKALNLGYLAPLKKYDFSIFFPSISSDRETGFKRGSVVLARGDRVVGTLHTLSSIRFHGKAGQVLIDDRMESSPATP
jgi:hypothetical protein